MSYTKTEFQPNQILYASQLNAMDEQIATNEEAINALKAEVEGVSALVEEGIVDES